MLASTAEECFLQYIYNEYVDIIAMIVVGVAGADHSRKCSIRQDTLICRSS